MLHSRFPMKSISAALATVAATALLCAPVANARPLGIPSDQGLPKSLADLIEHVSPAVVNIRVVTGGAAAGSPTQDATEGQGSGFIVSADGKVVTNYHVIEGGDKITVDFANGEEFTARVIGTDRETDLAMLQIQDKRSFDYVEFHRGADVRIGDWALAIGNPFGIGQSSSVGIISAIGRERVDSGSYVDYMQTDATVNRGNSGGPLFNFEGRVIGVNSAIYSPTGASVGIAFVGASLRDALKDQGGAVFRQGASIESIGQGSPADRAGLRVEDIILRIDNTEIKNAVEATRTIAKLRAGQTARFYVERDDVLLDALTVRIASRPQEEDRLKLATGDNSQSTSAASASAPAAPTAGSMYNTGLSLVDLSATFRDSIGMRPNQVGVYVDTVAPGSNAAIKGIKSGMVILEADSKPIASVSQFRQLVLSAKKSGQRSLVLLVRTINGSETYTSISLN